ncbi:hypothetical protein PENTCL1PPCAC_22830, partial [Pristionchus entomophagus]
MSSGFVSSSELSEERKKRQEVYAKRNLIKYISDAPEPEVCNKSLYDQLRINKDKKELEMQEERALKNLVRGIDEDESHFLSMVNDIQRKDEKAKKKEEEELLREMKEVKGKISIDLPARETRLPVKGEVNEGVKSKQARLIGSSIKRKSTVEEENVQKKHRRDESFDFSGEKKEENGGKGGGLVDYGSDSDEV